MMAAAEAPVTVRRDERERVGRRTRDDLDDEIRGDGSEVA
jgi:hypothetical protein